MCRHLFYKTFNSYKNFPKTSFEYRTLQSSLSSSFALATKPVFSLRHVAYQNFLHVNNIITPSSLDRSPLSSTNSSASLASSIDCICNSLICDSHLKQELINIATRFHTSFDFTFYTDGCVKHLGSSQCVSGYGWL